MKAPVLFALLAAPVLLAACETTKTTTVMAPEGAAVVAQPGTVVATPSGPVTTPTTVAVVPANKGDTCGAAKYSALIGQKSPVISVAAGTEFRHFRTGEPVTMDFSPERLNFEYDRRGKLVNVTCG